MPLNAKFFQVVEKLKAPRAGTELMGPLLYSLLRTTRPKNLLEVGMGYTTPFILEALKDNVTDIKNERDRLKIKNEKFLKAMRDVDEDFTKNSKMLLLLDEWLEEEPALLSPAFYQNDYLPVLHAIDNYSSDKSHATQVLSVLEEMQYNELFKVYNRSFHGLSSQFDSNLLDFVWFDCGGPSSYQDFLNEYWDKINPNGGHLLLHSTLDRSGFNNVVHYLKLKQATNYFMDFELLSLKEPHKLTQGSVTIIRKTNNQMPRFPIERADDIIKNIRKLEVQI